jgi:hypothetical protein
MFRQPNAFTCYFNSNIGNSSASVLIWSVLCPISNWVNTGCTLFASFPGIINGPPLLFISFARLLADKICWSVAN